MTTTYLCGLCPLGQEYRDENEAEVRKHITQSDDPRHRDHKGNDPDVVIYHAGEKRDRISLTMSLAEAASSTDDEKRAIAAALEYPYLSMAAIQQIADVDAETTHNLFEDHPRVALEQERRKLDYVRDDTRYKQRPDGTLKKPTIDPTERKIIEYAFEHPDGTVAEVKEELDLDLSTSEIRDIVQEKTICPHLPRSTNQRDALIVGHEHPEWGVTKIAEETDMPRTVVSRTLNRLFTDEEYERGDERPQTYLNLRRVAQMKLDPEEYNADAHELGFPVELPDERPTMHRHKDTLLYLYYYRNKRTLDDAGRVMGVTGQSVRNWLEKHGIHPKYDDYTFDIDELYHGHDEINDREYAHLIPSSRDEGEAPERVVIDAPNVTYEGPAKGIDTTTGNDAQTWDERPKKPGTFPKDPDDDDFLTFLDHDEVRNFRIPPELHDVENEISEQSDAVNGTAGALVQLPSGQKFRPGPLHRAVGEIIGRAEYTVAERVWAFKDQGYVSSEGKGPHALYYVTDEQKARLRGDEPETNEPETDEPVGDPHAPSSTDTSASTTAPTTTERVGITPPQPTATAAEVRAEQEKVDETTLIAGQHPDDELSDEDYVTLVRLVARDESALTDHDALLKKLMRLGGVALMDGE